jgi:hypothetical protein
MFRASAFDALFLALRGSPGGRGAFMAKAQMFSEEASGRPSILSLHHAVGTEPLPQVRAGTLARVLGQDPVVRALRRREECGASVGGAAVCAYELENGVTIATRSRADDACAVEWVVTATSYDDGVFYLQAECWSADAWAKLMHKLLADHARPGTRSDVLLDQFNSLHFVLTHQRHRMCILQASFTGVERDGSQQVEYYDSLVALVAAGARRCVPAAFVVAALLAELGVYFDGSEQRMFAEGPYFWPVGADRMLWLGWFDDGDGLMLGTCSAAGRVA